MANMMQFGKILELESSPIQLKSLNVFPSIAAGFWLTYSFI